MKFIDFLTESTAKHGVLAFGRMNPPTIGHEALVNKVKEVAKHFKGDHNVVLSHSTDPKKNPLTAQQKVKHAKRFFPGTNITAASSDKPTILHHAAEMHKKGITHLHVVGGSDRTDEYYDLLHKYNGKESKHGFYNFKNISVHSAGERDPDAEGVAGMSASKMREHASKGNFKEFKKGIPKGVKDEHAKELYNHVRQGMGIKEDVNLDFQDILVEGVHDKGIFKAVFLGGGPGSGKDFVLDKTLAGHGLTEINSDKALEFLMDKNNLDMRMPDSEEKARNVVRSKAKNMTELKQKLALMGRNGVIINGTGDDVEKIKKIKERLEDLGYDTSMVMVNTADEVSRQRNIERGQRGGRTVPEHIRKEKWDSVQAARAEHAKMFGKNYMEIDNSEDLRTAPPEIVQAKQKELDGIFKTVQKFVAQPPKSPTAKFWVSSELQKKDTSKIDTKKHVTPHEGSKAAEQARSMGLQYFGFGRYGKDGKVTHRSVHDKLVPVDKPQNNNTSMPVPGTSMKKVNEEFESMLSESYGFSDSSAMNLLLLGTKIDEVDVDNFQEEKKPKYLTDKTGGIRVFMLRRAASEEAHQRNGTVVPYKNGYVVKLKEESINVDGVFEKFVQETGRTEESSRSNHGRSNTAEKATTFLTEEKATAEEACCDSCAKDAKATRKKITIEEIRARKKEINESWMTGKELSDKIPKTALKQISGHDFHGRLTRHDTSHGGSGDLHYKHKTDQHGNHSVQVASNKKDDEGYTHHATFHITKNSISHGEYEKTKNGTTKSVKKFGYTNESIDKGIEPGVSMAGSGESIGRDMGEKWKKKTGKASPVVETIGDGGEAISSISDKKEDELKKKGINLSTFKARGPIT